MGESTVASVVNAAMDRIVTEIDPRHDTRPSRLHLGGGPVVAPGWDNLDKSPSVFLAPFDGLRKALGRLGVLTSAQVGGFPAGVKRADVVKGLRYEADSVDFIYSSHMIEHLSRPQGVRLLQECARVLTPGGQLRLACPDLRALTEAYLHYEGSPGSGDAAADAFMSALNMYRDGEASGVQGLIKKHLSGTWHQWLYDAESLATLMREGGLTDIRSFGYREGTVPDLDVLEHRPESLFMEGMKPVEQGR